LSCGSTARFASSRLLASSPERPEETGVPGERMLVADAASAAEDPFARVASTRSMRASFQSFGGAGGPTKGFLDVRNSEPSHPSAPRFPTGATLSAGSSVRVEVRGTHPERFGQLARSNGLYNSLRHLRRLARVRRYFVSAAKQFCASVFRGTCSKLRTDGTEFGSTHDSCGLDSASGRRTAWAVYWHIYWHTVTGKISRKPAPRGISISRTKTRTDSARGKV
jgi:hypothetical protein